MVEPANPSGEPQVQRRRSTRIVQTVPITVAGTDALGQPFKERTSALVINCHGCKYQSKHYVLKNHWVTVEVPHPEANHEARTVKAKVVWVQRPRTVQELFQVAVAVETPGNIWGVAFPPEDWFPYPEEAGPSIPAPTPSEPTAEAKPETKAEAPAGQAALPAGTPGKVRMLPAPAAASPEALATVERQVARMIADARDQIQSVAREAASASVTSETAKLLREVESQLRGAARKTVESISAQYLDEAIQKAVERIDQSRHLSNGALREKWQADFDAIVSQVSEKLAERSSESEQELGKRFRAQLEQAIQQATQRLGEVEQRMEGLRSEVTGGAAATQSRLEALRAELASADAMAQSCVESLRAELAAAGVSALSGVKDVRAELASIGASARAQVESLNEQLASADAAARARLETLRADLDAAADEATRRRQPVLDHLSEATQEELRRLEAAIKEFRSQVTAVEREDLARIRTIWREQLETDMTLAGEEWNSLVANAVSNASQKLARQWSEHTDRASAEAQQQMSLRLAALRQSFGEAAADAQQVLLAVRRDLEQDLFRAKGSLDDLRSASARAGDDAARLAALRESLAAAAEQQLQQALAAHLQAVAGHSAAEISSAKESISALAADLARIAVAHRDSIAQQSQARMIEMQQRADSISTGLASSVSGHLNEFGQAASHLRAEIARQSDEQLAAQARQSEALRAEVARQSYERLEALAAQGRAHQEAMTRQSEELLAGAIEALRPELDGAGRKSVERSMAELERQLTPRMQTAERLLADLASGQQRAEEFLLVHRERIHQLSEEYLTQADLRLKETRSQIEKEWETVSRSQLEKCLADLEEKSTEATHTTFEALYKAADWYQKKAQTSMQSAMEKASDQATDKLRDRAAEISRLFALELDHYSRSYTDHTKGLLEESARDVAGKNREALEQSSLIATAGFNDEIHRLAQEKLRLFAEESSATRDEMNSSLDSHAARVQERWVEFAGRSFTDFQERVAARSAEQLEEAQRDFQSSLLPVLEAWRADRETQHREWLEKLNVAARESLESISRSSGESLQQFQQRLQNTSNTWMVASVTTLNQHSKTVMETLAAAAETRLREACSLALTGMAQTLADQMRAISAQLTALPPQEP